MHTALHDSRGEHQVGEVLRWLQVSRGLCGIHGQHHAGAAISSVAHHQQCLEGQVAICFIQDVHSHGQLLLKSPLPLLIVELPYEPSEGLEVQLVVGADPLVPLQQLSQVAERLVNAGLGPKRDGSMERPNDGQAWGIVSAAGCRRCHGTA